MNTMIKALLLTMMSYPMVSAAQPGGCDAKRSSIEAEISKAQAAGNTRRVEGLKTALAEANENCTDAELHKEAQRKVTEAQAKLAERQQDLAEAKAKGKSAEKIAERQRKVDEAQADLEKKQRDAAQ